MREGGIGIEYALCGSVRISHRDTLDENLGLVEIEGEASVLLEYVLDVRLAKRPNFKIVPTQGRLDETSSNAERAARALLPRGRQEWSP